MNAAAGVAAVLAATMPPRQVTIPGAFLSVTLDCGGVHVACWPDAAQRETALSLLCSADQPVIRYAGGALIADLTLQDNLLLEAALRDGEPPTQLQPELEALFNAAAPLDWAGTSQLLPENAPPLARMQVTVGRAMAADPDLLLVDADAWDEELLSPAGFSRAFTGQYPWRALVWATHRPSRAAALRASLEEPSA